MMATNLHVASISSVGMTSRALGSVAHPQYNTDDVLKYLYGEVPPLAHAMEGGAPIREDGDSP